MIYPIRSPRTPQFSLSIGWGQSDHPSEPKFSGLFREKIKAK